MATPSLTCEVGLSSTFKDASIWTQRVPTCHSCRGLVLGTEGMATHCPREPSARGLITHLHRSPCQAMRKIQGEFPSQPLLEVAQRNCFLGVVTRECPRLREVSQGLFPHPLTPVRGSSSSRLRSCAGWGQGLQQSPYPSSHGHLRAWVWTPGLPHASRVTWASYSTLRASALPPVSWDVEQHTLERGVETYVWTRVIVTCKLSSSAYRRKIQGLNLALGPTHTIRGLLTHCLYLCCSVG